MEKKIRILIIDDDYFIVKALEDHFTRKGYEIDLASDGVEGLDAARATKPDIILLDTVMPRIDGVAMLARLKEDEELRAIPVIMISNLESRETMRESHRLGVSAYLIKANYGLEEFIEQINIALREK